MKQLKDNRVVAELRVTASVKCVMALAVLCLASTGVEAALLSHYTFDTDMTDATGLRDGVANGTAAITTGDYVVGNGSLLLNGAYGSVTLPNGAYPTINGLTDWTVAAWVKFNSTVNSFAGILAYPATDESHPSLYYNPNLDRVEAFTFGGALITVNPIVAPTGWFHVAMTGSSDGTRSLYINGVLEDSSTGNGPVDFTTSGTPFSIGDNNNGVGFFNGGIDDLRIYNNALSASEVGALAGVVPEPASLALVVLGGGLLVWRRRR